MVHMCNTTLQVYLFLHNFGLSLSIWFPSTSYAAISFIPLHNRCFTLLNLHADKGIISSARLPFVLGKTNSTCSSALGSIHHNIKFGIFQNVILKFQSFQNQIPLKISYLLYSNVWLVQFSNKRVA